MKWTDSPSMKNRCAVVSTRVTAVKILLTCAAYCRRYKAACVFSPDGKFLYVFGGHNEDEKLDSVEVLDTEENTWMELPPMPSKCVRILFGHEIAPTLSPDVFSGFLCRRSHVAGVQQPRSPYIYAVGGNDGEETPTKLLNLSEPKAGCRKLAPPAEAPRLS